MFKRYESPAASFHENLGTMKGLAPAHVVFNGEMGVLQSDGKLKAREGMRCESFTLRPTVNLTRI